MKVIIWNTEGIKKAQALQELLFLTHSYKPDILFILETMVTDKHLQNILLRLGFVYYDFVPATNHAGGIAVLWTSGSIHASFLKKTNRTIHLLVHGTSTMLSSIISGIYAPTQQKKKDSFWNLLLELNEIFDLPWCIIEDFNELANPSEKREGINHPCTKYRRLNNFLYQSNAISLPVNGSLYTLKKRIHMHLIYERLDRAIVCKNWMEVYPELVMVHGVFVCSDHCPIVLTTQYLVQQSKHLSFRFQNFWCQYRRLDKIVILQWQTSVSGTRMYKLMQKLKYVKLHVKGWSKCFFGNTRHKLAQNETKLKILEDKLLIQPDSPRLSEWMNRLLRQREKLLMFNQKYCCLLYTSPSPRD